MWDSKWLGVRKEEKTIWLGAQLKVMRGEWVGREDEARQKK